MIPVRLELHNFLSYRDPMPLDFVGMEVACLAGPNGAGKSSLLDAITWALWGRARARRDDELIHIGETEMQVALEFLLDSNLYRVSRYRSRQGGGRSALSLEIMNGEEWVFLSEASIRATQEKINHLLRIDYQTFINSALLLQGRADEFTTKTPAERKHILSEILGLELWAEYETRVKARLKAISQEQEASRAQLTHIEEELTQEDIYQEDLISAQNEALRLADELADVDVRARELEAAQQAQVAAQTRQDDLVRRVAQAEREIQQLMAEIAADDERLNKLREAPNQRADEEALQQVREDIAILQGYENDREALQNQRSALKEEAASLTATNKELRAKIEALDVQVRQLQDAQTPVCPLCKQPLDDAYRDNLIADLEQQGREEADAWRANRDRLERISTEDHELSENLTTLERELRRLTPLTERAAKLEERLEQAALAAEEEIPRLQEAIDQRHERTQDWQATLTEDQIALDEISAELAALQEHLGDIGEVQRTLERLRDEVGMARERIGAAEQKLAALDAQRARRDNLLERLQVLGEEQSIYEELRTAFGKDGVPAMIIEAAIPEIEQIADQLLAKMTDGRMHIRLETQREKVTGGVAETLDIRIADELGTRDYQMYSGGEAFRVNFAIRLALSKLLTRRAGAQLRTLFIDEGFGTQDAQGRERLVQAVNAIRDDFDLVLVITHIDEMKDAFPVRIEITKTPNGSQIELF